MPSANHDEAAIVAALCRGDGFEGRSSLKTWIFRILTNVAMRGGARERRSVPFAALAEAGETRAH